MTEPTILLDMSKHSAPCARQADTDGAGGYPDASKVDGKAGFCWTVILLELTAGLVRFCWLLCSFCQGT